MSPCRRWIANPWLATFAGALLALANGCGSSSDKPMGVLQNDAALDGSPDQKLEERMDARPDTAPADASAGDAAGDGAMMASDAAGDTAAPDAGMEVGASCTDNARNGNETDTDCGGSCGRCGVGKVCLVSADCASGACSGSHVCLECATAANCPGQDTECSVRACVNGACSVALVASGTVLTTQVAGDCRSRRCDGQGQVAQVNDDTDVPGDGNPCTLDVCTNGAPSNPAAASSSSCGANQICDGLGHCVGCLTSADCPGQDTDCQMRTCDTHGVCGLLKVAAGAATATQTTGDCRMRQCNSDGSVVLAVDDSDLPVDGKACTDDVCVAGVAMNPPRAVGAACGTGGHCDSFARCVACVTAADCSTAGNPCESPTCVNGTCGTSLIANGTPVVAQKTGDCQMLECDGSGMAVAVEDDTDVPVDGNACTDHVCTAGVPSNPPLADTVLCGSRNKCDGQGHCLGCMVAADCPGSDSVCQSRTCDVNGVCGVDNAGDGTPGGAQTTGDCRQMVCDGKGATRTAVDDIDVHDDGNPCTANVCNAGVASNPPLAAGSPCPAGVCDGQGHCIVCERNTDCGVDTLCVVHACDAAHTCRVGNVEPGAPVGLQVAGDCYVQQCDGQGSPTSIPDDTDLPDDGNPCTVDTCTNGAISHTAVAAGTSCGAGRVCDGQGSCGAAATPDAGAADATDDGG